MVISLIFYSLAIVFTIISFFKDRDKTKKALKKAYKSLSNLLPALTLILLFVGFLLTFLTTDMIGKILGDGSGFLGIIFGVIVGSLSFIPSFVAFPLGGTLLENGAGYPQVAAFLSAAMAVGVVSLAVEIKYFDKKMAIVRNVLALLASFLFAILIGLVM